MTICRWFRLPNIGDRELECQTYFDESVVADGELGEKDGNVDDVVGVGEDVVNEEVAEEIVDKEKSDKKTEIEVLKEDVLLKILLTKRLSMKDSLCLYHCRKVKSVMI